MLDFKRIQFVLLCYFFAVSIVYGQHSTPYSPSDQITPQLLNKQFKAWSIHQVDVNAIFAQVTTADNPKINLQLGDLSISSTFAKADLFSEDYRLIATTSLSHTRAIPMYSETSEGAFRLTVNKDFLYGHFKKGNTIWYLEPLVYFLPNAPKDLFVVYKEEDVKFNGGTCGVTEVLKVSQNIKPTNDSPEANCHQVDIAIASDFSMFQKYNTVVAVENHNIGVMNNVQANYIGVFTWDFLFNIKVHLIMDTNNDPWTASTDPFVLLPDFRSWGNNNGFGTSDYDVAQLWTNRDFDGSTVGLAYVGAVCSNWEYHILEDFGGNAQSIRVMTAHELGHNFDADHDVSGSPHIMAPSVSQSTTWSNASENWVNNYASGLIGNCLPLVSCSGAAAPVAEFTASPTTICAGASVTYTDNSTDNPTSWDWHFFGGTPEFFTGQSPPPIFYNLPGNFNTELTVSNGSGSNSITKNNFITVQQLPTASFTTSVIGLNVSFINQSIWADSYVWDFGDPPSGGLNSSNATNPSHTYPQDGTYTITLTAINSCGSDDFTFNLNINTPATASFTATPTTVCAGEFVQFTSTSSANTSQWNWTFENGTPGSSILENPSIQYNTSGFFNVSLIAASPGGSDQEFKSNYIHVLQSPTPGFTFVNTTGTTIDFTNTTAPLSGNTYQWHFGDASSSSMESPSHTYTNGGSYDVTLDVITSNCGTISITQTINLIAAPISGFTADQTLGCDPLTVTYTSTATGADSWNWTFSGGTPAVSILENPIVIYNTPGNYDATLEVTNTSGTDSHTVSNFINITATPTPSFTITTTGVTANFTNTTTPLSGNTYDWDFGDSSPTSSDTHPSHTYSSTGYYTVTLAVSNSCGTFTTTETFELAIQPVSNFSATHNGCVPDVVQFTDISQNSPMAWNWSFPGGIPSSSTAQHPSVTYTSTGSYDVTLVVVNAAGSNTKTNTNFIVVDEAPTADFTSITAINTTSFTNTSSSNVNTYSWDFGDGSPIDTDENPSHVYSTDGTYTVVLTVTNDCGNDTETHTVVITGNTPTAAITASNVTICIGGTIDYTAVVSANTQNVSWDFEGGNPLTSVDLNPTVTYSNVGTFDVTLTAHNGSNTAIANLSVTVEPNNTADFSIGTSGLTATPTNSSTNATAYSWDFGDSSPANTDFEPTHTYTADGVYIVCLTTTSNCNTDTHCETITISGNGPIVDIVASATNGCDGMSITYHADVTNSGSVLWTFLGGTPSTSTDIDVTVQYNTAGTFITTLSATNPSGTASDNMQIIVFPLPVSEFTASTNSLTVDFNNTSNDATSYSWDFGDSSPNSTDFEPTHVYAAPGTYDVCLTATNNCGTNTTCHSVTVSEFLPTAAIEIVSTSGDCAPKTVNFHANVTNVTTIAWAFEDGTPSTSSSVDQTVVFDTPGMYQVTLSATNTAGTVNATTVDIIVLPDPIADFSSATNGFDVATTNNSMDADSYNWDFGDSSPNSILENPTHTYAAGTYQLCLTVTNSCGSDTHCETIIISEDQPTADIEIISTSGDCAPKTVVFQANVTNSTTVNWIFENGTPATSNSINPTVIFNTAGTHQVTLSATNSSGTANATNVTIIVLPDPIADFSSATNGFDVATTNNSMDADSYNWDFGDSSPNSILENPTHTYAAGTYQLCLTVTNSCGSDTHCETIIITEDQPTADIEIVSTSGDCAPKTVVFQANVTNSTAVNWTFENGTPATSNSLNPTVVFNTPGNHQVTLSATNSSGTVNATNTNIEVLQTPTSNFGFSPNGFDIAFSNTSTNADTYSWDFGDGSTSTAANPIHTFTPGTYQVCLTATNNCGDNLQCETIIISENQPTAAIEITSNTGACAPKTVVFQANVTNSTDVNWTFENGIPATSSSLNPTVIFNTSGTHQVTLSATNSNGTANAQDINISVKAKPTADFTFDIDAGGYFVTTMNTGSTNDDYFWDFGDGTLLNSFNPSHLYNGDISTVIKLVATNICGVDSASLPIVIGAAPTANPTANVTSGCGPLEVNFTANIINADSYSWSFPTGSPTTSTVENPTITFTLPGTHTAELVVTNSLGSVTIPVVVTVLLPTFSGFGYNIDNATNTVTFTNSALNATGYIWDFGDSSPNSSDTDPVHVFPDGSFTTTLIAVGICNNDTSEHVFEFTPSATAPTAGIEANVVSGCTPMVVTFTSVSSANTESVEWNFPGGSPATSTAATVDVLYETAGTYSASLTATNQTGQDIKNQTIDVIAHAISDYKFSISDLTITITENTSLHATSYLWDFGDGTMSTEEMPTHTFSTSGTYKITLTAFNECSDSTYFRHLLIISGIDDPAGEVSILVSPNPSTGLFNLNITALQSGALSMRVFDILGRVVLDKNWGTVQNVRDEIDLSPQPAGNYIFQVQYKGRLLMGKFIKL